MERVKLLAKAASQHFSPTSIKSSKDEALNRIDQRIIFLDYLRIFAFVSVVVGHQYYAYLLELQKNNLLHVTPRLVLEYLLPFFNGGAGFIVFFIVSGYIISYVLTIEQPINFLIRRIFRIYPLYVMAVLSECLLVKGFPSANILIPQLLLIGDFLGTPYSLGNVEWTLRIEIVFYVFMAISKRIGLLNSRKQLMLSVLALAMISLTQFPQFPGHADSVGKGYAAAIFAPFLFIGVAYWLYEQSAIRIGTLLSIIALGLANHYYLIALYRPSALLEHYAALGTLVFMLAWYYRASFQITRSIVLLSNLTYSIYLFHNWLIPYLETVYADNTDSKFLIKGFALGSLIVLCYGLHVLIERPLNKYGRTVSLKY